MTRRGEEEIRRQLAVGSRQLAESRTRGRSGDGVRKCGRGASESRKHLAGNKASEAKRCRGDWITSFGRESFCGYGEHLVGDSHAASGHLDICLEMRKDGAERVLRGKVDRIEEVGGILRQARIDLGPQQIAPELPDAVGLFQGKATREM
jgi:hypothetical protein